MQILVPAALLCLAAPCHAQSSGQPASKRDRDTCSIVVLDEPRLPYYNVVRGAAADSLVQRLRAFGLRAQSKSAADIANGALAEAAVFVTLHGNCYPRKLEAALLSFQAHGGSIVSTGVPFTHPCAVRGRGWRDLGDDSAFMRRLGFGVYGGPARDDSGLAVGAAGRRVGLDAFEWKRLGTIESQYLNSQSLPPPSTCEPVLSIRSADGVWQPVSALLRHGAGKAPDAWALNLTLFDESGKDRVPHYVEIVARVVALVCEARGAIDLNAKPLPPVPESLRQFAAPGILRPRRSTPRPDSAGIYPHADGIAPVLLVADARAWSPEERLLARSIQGLANRDQARVWLHQKNVDPFWLRWLQDRGDVRQTKPIASLAALLKSFPPGGAVVYDPQQRHTINIATMIAGVEDLVVASPTLAAQHNLVIKHDLRGRFDTNAEAYAWAFKTLGLRLSRRVVACVNPSPNILLHDYLVSQRIFAFWISGRVDGRESGASPEEEKRVLAGILQRMPANIPVLGYPYAGEGIGIQEHPGVNLFSQTGKFLVPSDYFPNLSVMTATRPVKDLHQPAPRAIPLKADRVYVTLTMSDGDNLNTLYDWFIKDWRSEHHGKTPIGWTLGASAVDFYPAVVDWYFQHLTPTDHLQCAVSGIGYVYPDQYAKVFIDRERVLTEYLSLTSEYMQRLDQRTMWLMGAKDDALKRFATGLPATRALFADYGRKRGINSQNANSLVAGKPVFHVLADGGPKSLGRRLVKAVGVQRPAFAHAFLLNWDWRLANVAALAADLPDDYVLVRPDELAHLYQQWQASSSDDQGDGP